jgi:hypothetical protein
MKFLLGVGFGILGMWAYHGGKLQRLMDGAPEPMQQAVSSASARITKVANSDELRQVASTVKDKGQQANAPQIAVPTAAEVAGRPSEPLPRYEPEDVQVQHE